MTQDFFVRQSPFFAGILYVFQEKLTKHGTKKDKSDGAFF